MKVINHLLLTTCLFATAFASTQQPEALYQLPSTKSQVITQLHASDPFEISYGEWVYITNLKTKKSGWILKKSLEKLTGHHFNYQAKFISNLNNRLKDMSKTQKNIREILRKQRELSKALFNTLKSESEI